MTDCERSATLFGRAWDDELTVAERDGLECHFTACAACRREYDELARTLELVQALPRPHVDESFAPRVLAAALAREEAAATARRRWFALPSAWNAAPAFGRPALALAATFVVALGVGAFLMSRPVPGPVSAPSVAVVAPPATGDASLPPAVTPETAMTPTATAPALAAVPPTPARARERAIDRGALAAGTPSPATPTFADSLFDHAADVELVLDPVQLRRERGRGYTPASPSVRGEAASITF